MKKSFAMFLVLSILFSLIACDRDKEITVTDESIVTTTTNDTESSIEISEVAEDSAQDITESTTSIVTTTKPAPSSTIPDMTESLTTEATTTESPTTKPSATKPPTTKPPTTEPPVTEPPTTESPVTEPIDYATTTTKYSGRWYLQGYSDIFIDIARLGSDEAMNIEATGISLPGDGVTSTSYTLYPALIDGYDGWYHTIEIPFSAWNEWLTKKQISLNDTYITLGSRTFVRDAGTKDKYTGKFCKAALGTWYLDKNPDVQIVISVIGGNKDDGDLYGIDTQSLDLATLQYTKNDYCTITAARTSDWTNLGISVSNNTLTVSNSYGTKIFYREPTYPTEPPSTEPPTTEPPTTEPPTTEPPTTEPLVTEPPATEPAPNVLIISNTQTISDIIIGTDVYITSTGVVTFNNVTVNGNIYCYGQLKCSGCTANNVYAYAYGSMFSCGAFDGIHGKVGGGINCNEMKILDSALDYAFNKWGKS